MIYAVLPGIQLFLSHDIFGIQDHIHKWGVSFTETVEYPMIVPNAILHILMIRTKIVQQSA